MCSQFANCSKLLEPNNLLLWQFMTRLTYNTKCSNTRTNQYNKNAQLHHKSQSKTPNLEVAKRGRRSWSECTCLSWNTQKNTSPHVWKQRHINNNMKHNIKTKVNSNSTPKLDISKSFYILPLTKQFHLPLNKTFLKTSFFLNLKLKKKKKKLFPHFIYFSPFCHVLTKITQIKSKRKTYATKIKRK